MVYGLVRTKGHDQFLLRCVSTPQITDAFVTLFKHTPDKFFVNITTGLSGALKLEGQNKVIRTRTEIHKLILCVPHFVHLLMLLNCFTEEILVNKCDCQPAVTLNTMKWVHYEGLVCERGVELVGWTEGHTICNTGNIQTSGALMQLLDAVCKGHCYWRKMTSEEWAARIEQREQDIMNERGRKKRKDASSLKGKGQARKSRKVTKHQTAGTGDDDEEVNSNGDGGSGSDKENNKGRIKPI